MTTHSVASMENHSKKSSLSSVDLSVLTRVTSPDEASTMAQADSDMQVTVSETATGGMTHYPVSWRMLQTLSKSPRINVFVGCGTTRDLVFSVPKQLLAEFAPALRTGLSSTGALSQAVVILQDQDKTSVGWFLRFVLAGGTDKVSQEVKHMAMEMVVSRLCLISHLGITSGKLFDDLRNRLEALVAKGSIKMQDLARIYDEKASKNIREVADGLTKYVVSEILEGRMASSIPGATACGAFYSVASTFLKGKQSHIRWLQRGRTTPLTIFQLIFVYQFSKAGDDIRSSVTRDLIQLFDDGHVTNPKAYMQYGAFNADFEKDMQAAILHGAKQHDFLERKARRENRKVEAKAKAAANSPTVTSGTKAVAAGGAKPKKVTFGVTEEQSAAGASKTGKAGKKAQKKKRVPPVADVESDVVLVLTSAGELKRER